MRANLKCEWMAYERPGNYVQPHAEDVDHKKKTWRDRKLFKDPVGLVLDPPSDKAGLSLNRLDCCGDSSSVQTVR